MVICQGLFLFSSISRTNTRRRTSPLQHVVVHQSSLITITEKMLRSSRAGGQKHYVQSDETYNRCAINFVRHCIYPFVPKQQETGTSSEFKRPDYRPWYFYFGDHSLARRHRRPAPPRKRAQDKGAAEKKKGKTEESLLQLYFHVPRRSASTHRALIACH